MSLKEKTVRRSSSRRVASSPRKKKVRLAIECTIDERRAIKMFAAYEDMTVNDFVMDCVLSKVGISKCKHSHIPNIETEEALEATERGENLIHFDSVDDFFKSLRT